MTRICLWQRPLITGWGWQCHSGDSAIGWSEGHPNTLIACGTVQEELGVRGATTAAVNAKPDVAIVLEGTPADDTPGFSLAAAQGALGKGCRYVCKTPRQ